MGSKSKSYKPNKKTVYRWIVYLAGMVILALGICLNAKALLGVSPIISASYAVSELTGFSFGDITFIQYAILVALEFLIRGKNCRIHDLLQLVISLIFTRFMNVFNEFLPSAPQGNIPIQILVLLCAIVLVGIGISMTVNMDLIPNPGDGIVQALSWKIGKSLGTCKNIVDLSCVATTCIIGLVSQSEFIGTWIGLGTIIAMLLTGRAVAIFEKIAREPMLRVTGMDKKA